MSDIIQPLSLGVKERDIAVEVRDSFLDYAMSVIVARAIPDVRDGLKPVHRRIVFSLNELGIQHNKPYKKCARIVGDVVGKYHPHGDTSVYDALVRLAQDFSCRYPLVDGHGNFGSIDGDPPAAFRYTEARMARLASELVQDINKDTVDFVPNYDGEELEPTVLPARFPNLLANGTTGIAVGMATNIPPHNMGELIDAVLAIIDNPEIEIVDLMNNFLPGPDFPTAGLIMGKSGIKKAYETGNGSLIIRARANVEEHEGKNRIIITEIPYAVNKNTLVKKIADLAKDKIIDGISDLRDESSQRVGIRIVIELKKDCVPEVLLNHLYKLTALQTTFSINFLALDKGQPKVMGIKTLLGKYIEHQKDVIVRRSRFELNKAKDREHILEGLKIIGDFPDEVYKIIKESATPDGALETLMTRFSLSEKQGKVILDTPLKRLTQLEKHKIEEEIEQLRKIIGELEDILANDYKVLDIIKKDLSEVRTRFADVRRSEITNSEFDISDEELIPQEDIIISITANGYIKRVGLDTYRTQNRGGRGIKGVVTYEDDQVERLVTMNTHSDLLFFSNLGRVYRIRGYQVPEYSRTAKGLPVINLLKLDKEEKICSMINVKEYNEDATLLFVSKNGVTKRTMLSEFNSIRQNGKIAFGLREDDSLLDVKLTDGKSDIIIATSGGRAACFEETQIRTMGRTAVGVRGINVDGSAVIGVGLSLEGDKVFVISENGFGKCSLLSGYRKTRRGAKGVKTMNTSERNGSVVALKIVNGNEELLITTTNGVVIRVSLNQIPLSGRVTQGVRLIRLDEGQKVKSVTVLRDVADMEDLPEATPIDPADIEEGLKEEALDDDEADEIIEDDEIVETVNEEENDE